MTLNDLILDSHMSDGDKHKFRTMLVEYLNYIVTDSLWKDVANKLWELMECTYSLYNYMLNLMAKHLVRNR